MLRGTGAAMALPLLDSMVPAQAAPKPPVRLFFYIVGGGAYLPYWTIDDSGRATEMEAKKSVEWLGKPETRNEPLGILSPSLEPLEPVKKDVLVLGGLALTQGLQFEDGHSGEIATLLTASPLAPDRVQCAVSVDQVAARHFDGRTYLDALVLGLHGARPGGAKGVGRVYAQHYSWRTPTTPTGEERNPRRVFERLFRAGASAANGGREAEADRRSVLDLVLDDAKRLRATLGGTDREKLDEYLASVRDVEKRIDFAEKAAAGPPPADAEAIRQEAEELGKRIPVDKGVPESYADYDRLMVDLVALAFRADLTRVAVLTHGGYRAYPEVGVKRGHHDLAHHEGIIDKRNDLCKVDRFNADLFVRAVEKFGSVREGEGRLLDRSMVLFASGMSNGNRHSRQNLPVVLAGRGDGTLRPGRFVDYDWKRETPICNLYVEMLKRAGLPVDRFGDSTGGLPHLS
jgi:hypothetical protein